MERFLDTPWLKSFATKGKPQLTLKETAEVEVLSPVDQNNVVFLFRISITNSQR